MAVSSIERRIHLAGIVIAVGLLVQVLTLLWIHPLAFVAFSLVGTPLVVAGSLFYLYSLVAREQSKGGGR